MRKYWWVILIICLLVLGAICGFYYWVALKYQKDQKSLQDELAALRKQTTARSSATQTVSAGAEATATASANLREKELASAKVAVQKFLEAKQTRLLENAKPYMTESFYASNNQEGFAGTSSPSMGRFEVNSAKFVEAAGLYEVKTKVYSVLNGQETGYDENSYFVVDEDGTFLVNEIKEGETSS